MNHYHQTRGFLRRYNISPKKRLGQHFMTDLDILQRMISYADVSNQDVVLEVGAGLGFLTRLLAKRCKRVIAVEIDSKLVDILRRELCDLPNVYLVEGDVFTAVIPTFNKIVSTPPYSISSPLLFWLFEKSFDVAVLTFQKELAERLAAPVGSKDYGRLTVNIYYRADVELLDHVPRMVFYPPPEIDSIIVRLKAKSPPPFKVKNEQIFSDLVRMLFTQRNRKVRNALLPFLQKRRKNSEIALELADSVLFHEKRVRDLAPEDFGALANEIFEKTGFLQ
jgi:16S rRNA (adenine1518-N6/adenine1519-N6)-dimethyltransferase